MKIILGSSSSFRKQVLQSMGYEFESMSPDIDEKAIRDKDPIQLTLKIARAKSQALLQRLKEKNAEPCILITCDQVIFFQGSIREKPKDEEECREFLRSYKDDPAEAICGVVVVNTKTGKTLEGTETAKQYFHPLPETLIDELIKKGDVFYCSGGFEIEQMEPYLKKREGERETILGLPKTLTSKLIEEVQKE